MKNCIAIEGTNIIKADSVHGCWKELSHNPGKVANACKGKFRHSTRHHQYEIKNCREQEHDDRDIRGGTWMRTGQFLEWFANEGTEKIQILKFGSFYYEMKNCIGYGGEVEFTGKSMIKVETMV